MRIAFGLLFLFSVGCATECDFPRTTPLRVPVYDEEDPRPAVPDFVLQAEIGSTRYRDAEYMASAWVVGETLHLGAIVDQDRFVTARFRLSEMVSFDLGPDVTGEVSAEWGPSTLKASAGHLGSLHWIEFEIPRDELPDGSCFVVSFVGRSERRPASATETPLLEDIPFLIGLPPTWAIPEQPEDLQRPVLATIRYVDAP